MPNYNKDWNYEKEFQILSNKEYSERLKIRHVTLGTRMPKEKQHRGVRICESRNEKNKSQRFGPNNIEELQYRDWAQAALESSSSHFGRVTVIREDFDHGFPKAKWELAKEEAVKIMADVARRRGMITYSELISKIRSIRLDAHDPRLFHFLGEISKEEDVAQRGMLTVVVVHKRGDMEPGRGFYELAASLGRETADLQKCWIDELHRVHAVWSKK